MKTQVSILVKNEGFWSRTSATLFWFVAMFKKTSLYVRIDDPNAQPLVLKARKEPYEIELTPGNHILEFIDPRTEKKQKYTKLMKKTTGALMWSSFSGASGGSMIGGAIYGAETSGNKTTTHENFFQCSLNPGDEVRISAQAKMSGKVKVKVLK